MFLFQRGSPFKTRQDVEDTYNWLMKGLDAMHERHKNDNVVKFEKKNAS